MNFETRFRIQKWLIEHGPINWLARLRTWVWEKNTPETKGFGMFHENDPTSAETKQYRNAKYKAEHCIFEQLTQEQHDVISKAEPAYRGATIDTLLPGKFSDPQQTSDEQTQKTGGGNTETLAAIEAAKSGQVTDVKLKDL